MPSFDEEAACRPRRCRGVLTRVLSAMLLALPALYFGPLALAEVPPNTIIVGAPVIMKSPGGHFRISSPVVADIDGSPANGLEIAAAQADGDLVVFRADGSLLWSADLPNSKCGDSSDRDKAYSSPAVGQLYGSGAPYVVVGYGGFGGTCPGGVAAYRGTDGKLAWNFDIGDFAKKQKFYSFKAAVFSTPALADVDGDGTLEIGFGGFDRTVYLLNHDGSVRWYYNAADTVWSSPAFYDANGDGKLEMFIGTDISKNAQLNPPTKDGGMLYSFNTAAVSGMSVPFRDPRGKIVRWVRTMPQVVYSSPVLADLTPKSPGYELVVGTGCYFPENSPIKRGNIVKIFGANSGAEIQTIPTNACSPSVPAVGDLNGDGYAEVVLAAYAPAVYGPPGRTYVQAFSPRLRRRLWTTELPMSSQFQSPIIADIDYDNYPEVIQPTLADVVILDGKTGLERLRLGSPGSSESTPSVADFDKDGRPDLVVAGHTAIYIYPNLTTPAAEARRLASLAKKPVSPPWSGWRGGAKKDGIISKPAAKRPTSR